jgi:hypothetical protein
VYCDDSAAKIAVSREKIKPGKQSDFTVTYTPGLNANIVNLTITVITNDPLSPVQTVRLTAELTD